MQEVQRFIVAELAQREKEEALRIWLEAQLNEILEFIETQGHHNRMMKEAKSLDSIEEAVCRIAACESACRDPHRPSPICHPRQRLDRLSREPVRPAAPAGEAPSPAQPQPAAGGTPWWLTRVCTAGSLPQSTSRP